MPGTAIATLCAKVWTCPMGSRKFNLSEISRNELYSANRETEKETGIPYMTSINDEKAKKILNS